MTQTELTREKQGLVPCQVLLSHWGSNTCLVVMQKKAARPLWKEAGLGPQVGVRSVGAAGQMLLLKLDLALTRARWLLESSFFLFSFVLQRYESNWEKAVTRSIVVVVLLLIFGMPFPGYMYFLAHLSAFTDTPWAARGNLLGNLHPLSGPRSSN